MKRSYLITSIIFISLVIGLLLSGCMSQLKEDNRSSDELLEVQFNNSGMTSCWERLLTKTEATDLKQIIEFNCYSAGITDIGGIERLTYLTKLGLYGNLISDLSALDSLTSLKTLDLSSNKISVLSPLEPLKNLEDLNLTGNFISDVSSLSNLTKLTTLTLYRNQITDISSLSSLTELSTLWLSDNNFDDLTSLSTLSKLTKLYVSKNAIGSSTMNLTPLKDLSLLEIIEAEDSNVALGVGKLINMVGPTTINLKSNQGYLPCADLEILIERYGTTVLQPSTTNITDCIP